MVLRLGLETVFSHIMLENGQQFADTLCYKSSGVSVCVATIAVIGKYSLFRGGRFKKIAWHSEHTHLCERFLPIGVFDTQRGQSVLCALVTKLPRKLLRIIIVVVLFVFLDSVATLCLAVASTLTLAQSVSAPCTRANTPIATINATTATVSLRGSSGRGSPDAALPEKMRRAKTKT
jgi:hypothetical protein